MKPVVQNVDYQDSLHDNSGEGSLGQRLYLREMAQHLLLPPSTISDPISQERLMRVVTAYLSKSLWQKLFRRCLRTYSAEIDRMSEAQETEREILREAKTSRLKTLQLFEA
jgi:hypothetical protein